MEESSCMSKVKEATGTEGSARAEEPETHTEVIEAKGSWRAVEAKEPEGSSGDKDTSGRTGKRPTAGIRRSGANDSCLVRDIGGRPCLSCVSQHR